MAFPSPARSESVLIDCHGGGHFAGGERVIPGYNSLAFPRLEDNVFQDRDNLSEMKIIFLIPF